MFGFFCIYLVLLLYPSLEHLFSVVLIASQETGLFPSLLRKLREGAVPWYRETGKHKRSQLIAKLYCCWDAS